MSAINRCKSVVYVAVGKVVCKFKFCAQVAFFALIFSVSYDVKSQTISLTLVGRDSRTGMQINPEFEAKSTTTENKFTVSSTNNYKVVKVQRGNEVIITAQLDGYYPDEKTVEVDDSFDNDGRTIVFELDPQPAASLNFDIKDKVNNKKVDATLTFKSGGKIIKQINSQNGSNLSNIILTLPGEYTIEASAVGYETTVINETIRVNDPVVQFNKEIKLDRESNAALITVLDKQSGKVLTGASLRITNDKNDVLKNDKSLAAEMEINLKNSKSITVEVAADDYIKFNKTFDLKVKKIRVELEKAPQIFISAVDAENDKLMAVNVEITTPTGKTITLKSTSTEPYKFIPEETGSYMFNVSKEGFKPEASTVNVAGLANYNSDLKFTLKNLYEDFTILAIDESKKPLLNAVIKVFADNNKEIDLKKNQTTGEVTGKLIRENNYKYSISSPGFVTAIGKLNVQSGNSTSVITLKKELLPVMISTFDKFSNKPLKTAISYAGKPNNASIISEKHEVLLPSGGMLSPVFTAAGYKKYQADPITNQTDAEIFMVADQYPITFKFTDQKGSAVKPDFVSVTNQATNQAVALATNNVAQMDAEASYALLIKKDGFAEREMLFLPAEALRSNGGIKTIELSQSPFIEQHFKIINSATGKPVSNPKVVVQSPNGKLYDVTQNDNTWVATLKNGEGFSIAVEAVGYENNAKQFTGNASEMLEIKLEELKLDAQVFEAFDEILNRTVAAKFTLFDEDTSKDLPTFDQGVHAKSDLIKGKKYTIRISAPDYRDKQEEFIFENPSPLPKRISFKRNLYPITIKLVTTSNKPLLSPTLNLTANNQQVKTTYLFDKKSFLAEIRTDEVYDILLNVAGFKAVNEKLNLADVVSTKLIKEIILEEVVEVIPETEEVTLPEVVITTEKETEVPPLQEEVKPAPKPVVVADVYTKNKENLEDLPENITVLTKTLTSEEAIGKRYILTKVYFERSTPTMKPESDEQLNAILAVLSANPKLKVELVGHTDNVGDSRQNQYLSQFRAKVVSSFLFNKGIDDKRVIIKGLGSEFPVAPNDTEDNKAQNRRVELIVIEN